VTHVLTEDTGSLVGSWTRNVLALGGIKDFSCLGRKSVSALVRLCINLSILR
jgi:hypothetical protein